MRPSAGPTWGASPWPSQRPTRSNNARPTWGRSAWQLRRPTRSNNAGPTWGRSAWQLRRPTRSNNAGPTWGRSAWQLRRPTRSNNAGPTWGQPHQQRRQQSADPAGLQTPRSPRCARRRLRRRGAGCNAGATGLRSPQALPEATRLTGQSPRLRSRGASGSHRVFETNARSTPALVHVRVAAIWPALELLLPLRSWIRSRRTDRDSPADTRVFWIQETLPGGS